MRIFYRFWYIIQHSYGWLRTPASVGMPIGIPIGIPMKHCGYHGIFWRRILQLFKVALENGPFIVGLPITMVIFDSYVS